MNENDYLGSELADEFLQAQADAGDYFLEEKGYEYRPTQHEIQMLALQGRALLFIDSIRRK